MSEGFFLGEEIEFDSMNKVVNFRKVLRRRVLVLSFRFSDFVVVKRKDNKLKFVDIESGLYEIYFKRRDNNRKKGEIFSFDIYLVKKEFKEEKLSLFSYRYYFYC